jgi:hypothetical protein
MSTSDELRAMAVRLNPSRAFREHAAAEAKMKGELAGLSNRQVADLVIKDADKQIAKLQDLVDLMQVMAERGKPLPPGGPSADKLQEMIGFLADVKLQAARLAGEDLN